MKRYRVFYFFKNIFLIFLYLNFKFILSQNIKMPPVLHVMLMPACSGSVESALSIYKNLIKIGWPASILVAKNSYAEKTLCELNLPFFTTKLMPLYKSNKKEFSDRLFSQLKSICINEKIKIINCHKYYEYDVAKKVSAKLGLGTVAFYHVNSCPRLKTFKEFDAFITTSPQIAKLMHIENNRKGLGIKDIAFISPPLNEERIKNFTPQYSTSIDFFKAEFGLELNKSPIICTIANFYPCKNHELLFEAIHHLTYKDKIQVNLILAGSSIDQERIKYLKQYAIDLNIADRVNFLGYTSKIPDLLFYSDMKILPSYREAFGIAILEAALMKKPIIILEHTGAANCLIYNEKTGLLAKKNNSTDLANQIKRLISDKHLCSKIGQSAYNLANQFFTNK